MALSIFHLFLLLVRWSAHTLICLELPLFKLSSFLSSSSDPELSVPGAGWTILTVAGVLDGAGCDKTISNMSPHTSKDGPTMNWMKPGHKERAREKIKLVLMNYVLHSQKIWWGIKFVLNHLIQIRQSLVIWDLTTKFNSHQYLQLYNINLTLWASQKLWQPQTHFSVMMKVIVISTLHAKTFQKRWGIALGGVNGHTGTVSGTYSPLSCLIGLYLEFNDNLGWGLSFG